MPQKVGTRAPQPVGERAADRCHQSQHHRQDRQPEPRRQLRVVVDAHQGEGDDEEHPEQGGVGQEVRRVAEQERGLAQEMQVEQRRCGAALGADEQDEKDDRQQQAAEQGRRCRVPRRGRWFSTATTAVSAGAIRIAPRQSKPPVSGDRLDRGRTSQPRTAPARPTGTLIQKAHCQPSVSRTRPPTAGPAPRPIGLGRRLQPEGAPAFLGAGGHDDDGDAVRCQQRGADRLQDAERDQHRKVRGEAAQVDP